MDPNKIVETVNALPEEQRAEIIDSILQGMNLINQGIESEWIAVAQKRLLDIQSGKVETTPGDVVFERIQKRFEG